MEEENIVKWSEPLKPNIEIYIAEDVCFRCHKKYTWLHKFFAKFLLGWKIIRIKK
jgi:hypothetical protein